MLSKRLILIAAAGLSVAGPGLAQPGAPRPEASTYAQISNLTPPVTSEDITDRPYRVLGEVHAEVRKATVFSPSPSRQHVYHELWERAERLGADAVVRAQYGDARITGLSWGSRRATGQAIKFLTDAEIAAQAPAAAAAPEAQATAPNPQ
jgi:uncharacterized protein YbjQ (UPF0145 family)